MGPDGAGLSCPGSTVVAELNKEAGDKFTYPGMILGLEDESLELSSRK
jgi:hypothetical protein